MVTPKILMENCRDTANQMIPCPCLEIAFFCPLQLHFQMLQQLICLCVGLPIDVDGSLYIIVVHFGGEPLYVYRRGPNPPD